MKKINERRQIQRKEIKKRKCRDGETSEDDHCRLNYNEYQRNFK